MAFEQLRLFGASISQINIVGGLNGQESRLEVVLVEDLRNGDAFIPPIIYSPVYFSYYGLEFGGILTAISAEISSSGQIYRVSISDPRRLLQGVQVILDSYNGTTNNVPNIINVFGYLESFGYGTSGFNPNGLKWSTIRSTLITLFSTLLPTTYSSGIRNQGYVFGLDISELPTLDDNVRFAGALSLFDLISQVCEMACCDFLVKLYASPLNQGVIKIQIVNRSAVPAPGVIANFISSTPGAVQKSIGIDAVMEPTGKFLIGAKKRDIYFQTYDSSEDYTNPIWPFWGYDLDNRPCLGTGTGINHVFVLDARAVRIPGVGDTYVSSVGEMMAALESMEAWESYLALNNFNEYILDPEGEDTAEFVNNNVEYKHSGVRNPHFLKASELQLDAFVNDVLLSFLTNTEIDGATNIQFDKFVELIPGKKENSIELLFNLVRDVAEKYYGKSFMVGINQIEGVYDEVNDTFICNAIPVDDGYLDNQAIDTAIANNLAPVDINRLINSDTNMIRGYVRFDNVPDLDFSEIPLESILWNLDGNSIFIEATIESDVFFINNNPDNPTYPKVVVNLPGRVKIKLDDDRRFDSFIANFIKSISLPESVDLNQALQSLAGSPVIAYLTEFREQMAIFPNLVAIPLESQVSRYGPWTAIGNIGPVDLEIDDNLSPWNFANTTIMNNAANAIVATSVSLLQQTESGAIEFPGVPAFSIGDRLDGIGPYISQIEITVGEQGVKTSYRMEFWKNRPGSYARVIYNRLQDIAKIQRRMDRNSREVVRISKKFRRNLVRKTYG